MKTTLQITIILVAFLFAPKAYSQEKSIQDLDFLIGVWETREDNAEQTWWEESTRTGRYVLDSSYIELKSIAISSNGEKRTYLWLVHYNAKAKQFEMVLVFSNWHEMLVDILDWDSEKRELTIRNREEQNSAEYHERFGTISFDKDFNQYIWSGENKYGDPNSPSIWKYTEKGVRISGG